LLSSASQKFLNFYEWFKERWFLRGEKPFLNTQYVALAKKRVSLSPLTPLFPKTLTTKPVYSILVRVKKFGKRGV